MTPKEADESRDPFRDLTDEIFDEADARPHYTEESRTGLEEYQTPQEPERDPFEASTPADERQWAMLTHLSGLAMYVLPFGNLIGPLIFWMLKRDEMPAVDQAGKAALNFQLSISIYLIVGALLSMILIGLPILFGAMILHIVGVVQAAVKANNGEAYQYPFTMTFLH